MKPSPDDAVLLDVVGYVGNVYAHFPQVCGDLADTDGIVKVLGPRSVSPKHRLVPVFLHYWSGAVVSNELDP